MSSTGPYVPRKVPTAVVPPRGSEALAQYGRSQWRSGLGMGVIMLGLVIVAFAVVFYTLEPSDWRQDLYLAAFGVLLTALVFVASWIMTPRPPPQKD